MSKVDKKSAELLDVDIRFLLANERTLLAWVRTALTVLVGGLAFIQFGDKSSGQIQIGLLASAFALVMIILGYTRYRKADAAIRRGYLPDVKTGPLFQVVGIICLTMAIIVFEVRQL